MSVTAFKDSKAHIEAIIGLPTVLDHSAFKSKPRRFPVCRSFSHNRINFPYFVSIQHIKFPYQSDGCLKSILKFPCNIVSKMRTENRITMVEHFWWTSCIYFTSLITLIYHFVHAGDGCSVWYVI